MTPTVVLNETEEGVKGKRVSGYKLMTGTETPISRDLQ